MTADLVVAARHAYDGHRWRGPTRIEIAGRRILRVVDDVEEPRPTAPQPHLGVDVVTPGLVDAGVSANGYSEMPDEQAPFAPETAFGALCRRWGVTAVVDVANDAAPLAHLSHLADQGLGPAVVQAGARLCQTPRQRLDLALRASDVASAVAAQRQLGAGLVSLGAVDDVALLDAVAAAAQAEHVPIVLGRQYPAPTPGLLWWRPGGPAPAGHPGGSDGLPDGFFASPAQTAAALRGAAVWYAPQCEAAARWTVDDLLTATDAALAAPFLPYSRNFARLRGVLGRRIGRDVLRTRYGARASADLGDDRLDVAARHLSAGTCLAASGAGGVGLVPGYSLWLELHRLAELVDGPAGATAALHAGTGAVDGLLPGWAGVLQPGRRADLLLYTGVQPGDPPLALREAMTAVVCNGQLEEVRTMAQDVNRQVELACQGA